MVSSDNKVLIFLEAATEERLLEHESIPKIEQRTGAEHKDKQKRGLLTPLSVDSEQLKWTDLGYFSLLYVRGPQSV